MLKYLVRLLIILSIVAIVTGCRCGIPEENDRYCRAQFASILFVKGKAKEINNENVYNIYTIKHLKPQVQDGKVIDDKVYTATSSAACGVQLERGIYLIAGTYRDGGYGMNKQYIGLCSISRKLTRAEAASYRAPKCPKLHFQHR